MFNWIKTTRGNYITSFPYNGTDYNIQVYGNGVYKVVEIAYKINILGRKTPFNKILFEGFSRNVFDAMTSAEKSLKKYLKIEEPETIFTPKNKEEEEVVPISQEEEAELKTFNKELYEEIKDDIEEQKKSVCTEPSISVVNTEAGVYATLSGDVEDEIRFTINNKGVTSSSRLYRKPFLLKPGTILKVKAFNKEKKPSKQVKYTSPTEE